MVERDMKLDQAGFTDMDSEAEVLHLILQLRELERILTFSFIG